MELGWTVFIIKPKGNVDNQGIGLLEVMYNLVEAVIDTCIK